VKVIDERYKADSEIILEAAKADLGDKARGQAFCWFPEYTKTAVLKGRKYVEVVVDGEHISNGGDRLWMIDAKLVAARKHREAQEARDQLEDSWAGRGRDGTGRTPFDAGGDDSRQEAPHFSRAVDMADRAQDDGIDTMLDGADDESA